jgi:hypothetical protein
VPAFTSAGRLAGWLGQDPVPPFAAMPELRFPIDVTFPGENEPDQVDAWISAYAEPFFIRS